MTFFRAFTCCSRSYRWSVVVCVRVDEPALKGVKASDQDGADYSHMLDEVKGLLYCYGDALVYLTSMILLKSS